MSVFDWSVTAADNDNSDSNINWAEGQAPSTVNDSSRAEMARIAHWRNMLGANVTMGGTGNAYTYTTGETLTAYSDGIRLLWQPNANPTGAVTINVDTIGAKKVYMPDGTPAGNGDLDADSLYDIVYDSSLDSSAGAFKIVGFPDTTLTAGDYLTVANNLSDVASASTARSNLGAYGASDNVSFGTITATGDVTIDTDTLFVDVSADRVGVNVAAPDNALHVQSESGDGIIRMTTANGTYDFVWACTSAGNFYLNDVTTGTLPFVVELGAGSNTLRVDSNSRVGIGTASPGDALEVVGDVTAVDFNATSDARLKENVEPLPYGLEAVLSMQPRAYDWIEQKEHDIGFIAQELEGIVPEVVSQKGDYKRVSYGKLVAVLAKAIQELTDEVRNGRS